jgi:hypothetical protein
MPVPVTGVLPARVPIAEHLDWSGPAAAVVGSADLVIVISSVEEVQTPFEIVHRNVFTPTLNAVTPDVGEPGVVIVAVPAMTVQIPVPASGVFPPSVAVVEQTAWSRPALETVGKLSRVIVMSSVEGGQVPFEMVQRNVFAPTLNPVTSEVGEDGLVKIPPPAIMVQVPVPVTAGFPASVSVKSQTVLSGPAKDIVGKSSRVIIISSTDGAHAPFAIFHRNVFAPGLNPVTSEVGEEGVITVAVPVITVHVPVPVTGVFPARVSNVAHTVSSDPAIAIVGLL